MSDAVLPSGKSILVVGKSVSDKLAYSMKGQPFMRALNNCHGNQSNIRIWGFDARASLCLDVILGVFVIYLFILNTFLLVTLLKLSFIKGFLF